MGGLVRVPVRGKDILIDSSCDSPEGRHHGTDWSSFDDGEITGDGTVPMRLTQ